MLLNKVAIITGAASGMGRAGALLFARNGAKVTVADIDEKGGEEVVAELKKSGGQGIFVKTDVSQSKDAKNCLEKTVSTFGRLDCLYNNAGINPSGTVLDTSEDLWERTIGINLKGMFLMSKFSIPEMKKTGSGSIVNIASVDGLMAIHNEAAYIASKGGVIALTRSMALDFARDKIRVNCICPGAVRTPLVEKFVAENPGSKDPSYGHAMARMGEPEEVARVAMFLLSDQASFMTGSIVPVDGGYSSARPEYIEW